MHHINYTTTSSLFIAPYKIHRGKSDYLFWQFGSLTHTNIGSHCY